MALLCACVISKASMFAWAANLSPPSLAHYPICRSGSGSLSVNVSMSDDAWSSTHIHVASGMGVETQEACSAEVSSHASTSVHRPASRESLYCQVVVIVVT